MSLTFFKATEYFALSDVSTETPLMKQVLSYKNNADIPMMTTPSEQVTYVFRIHLVQQVVENYEKRFTVVIAKILRYTLVKTDVLM